MDPILCFPTTQAHNKIIKKNGYFLKGPDQNYTLEFVKYIVSYKKRNTQVLISCNINFEKFKPPGENDLNISKLHT